MTRSSSPPRQLQFCASRRRPCRCRWSRARASAARPLSWLLIDGIRQALDLAAAELGPGQPALDALGLIQAEGAGQAFDMAVGQGLELAQARRQAEGIDAHGIQAAEAARGLRPLAVDLLAQRVVGLQQPG